MNDLVHPCQHWAEPISLAAAGCLSSDEEQEVRRHVETCPDCGEQLRQLTELCRALAEAPLATDSTEATIVKRIVSEVTADVLRRPFVRTQEEMIHPTFLSRSLDACRWIMRSPVSGISATAILALATGGLALWFYGGGTTPAFADFIEPILRAKTVTFKTTFDIAGHRVRGKVMAMASPQRMRLEQDKIVTIYDHTGNGVTLRPDKKVAIVTTLANAPNVNRPDAFFFELRSQLADARDQPKWIRQPLGEKVIDGRPLVGYRLTGDGMICDVWGDPKTGMPVRLENSAPSNPNMKPTIYSDFVFDADLDESLFSLEPPAGYKVQKLASAPIGATTIRPILAIPPQTLDPNLKDQRDVGDNLEPMPPQSQPLFRDDFSDLTTFRGGLSDGKAVRNVKPTRAVWPFAAAQFKGQLALIISELPEAVGADGRPGVLRVEWEHVPESIDYSGFRYQGRPDTAQRFMLPQIMTARTSEELRGFKFRAKFKAENANLRDEATIKFDLRIEPVEDRSYDNRLDFGTIEASSMWKTFEIDFAEAKNGERFIEMFARRGSGLCALILAQAGSINDYHDGDGVLIDDIEVLDRRPPEK
jgi:outer membrane lipoprotein-sorting protein